MAHGHNDRHHKNAIRSEASTPRLSQDSVRPLATVQQMRDPLGVARDIMARRFAEEYQQSIRARARLEIEDLRHGYPDNSSRSYRRADGSQAYVVRQDVRKLAVRGTVPAQMRVAFRSPQFALVCQRRRTRRAVIFALRRAGKGGSRNRKARWSEHSEIVCRRSK